MNKERIINNAINNIHKSFKELDKLYTIKCIRFIAAFKNSNPILKRISNAKDIESINDCIVEMEFAIYFYSLNFMVEFEPLGKKGPDLMISKENNSCHVEITRFRKMYPGPSHSEFQQYGNSERDTQKAFNKIINKFEQLKYHPSILAIWNDDGDLEDTEVKFAIQELLTISHYNIPRSFKFILYSSNWCTIDNTNIYCYPICLPLKRPYNFWSEKFEESNFIDRINDTLNLSTL